MTTPFADLAVSLLPPGSAWPRDIDGTIYKLWQGLTDEFERLNNSAQSLSDEVFPDTTTELISEWESIAGLPDEPPYYRAIDPLQCGSANCNDFLVLGYEYDPTGTYPADRTLAQRQQDIVAKLATPGGSSKQYFIDLMASFGHTVSIVEHKPAWSGVTRSGDCCYSWKWLWVWDVLFGDINIVLARSGSARSGDPIMGWDPPQGLYALYRYKPAHTFLRWGPLAVIDESVDLIFGGFLEDNFLGG